MTQLQRRQQSLLGQIAVVEEQIKNLNNTLASYRTELIQVGRLMMGCKPASKPVASQLGKWWCKECKHYCNTSCCDHWDSEGRRL